MDERFADGFEEHRGVGVIEGQATDNEGVEGYSCGVNR